MAHLPIFSISFPSNAHIMYQVIAAIAMMDLVETGPIIQEWFEINNEVESHSMELEVYYGYTNLISNLGMNFFIWIGLFAAIPLSLLIKLCSKFCRPARIVYNKFCDYMYYTVIVRFFLQSILELAVCGFIDLSAMNFSNGGYAFSYALSFIAIGAIVFYAFVIRHFLHNNVYRFHEFDFKKKFGEMYSGLKEPYQKWLLISQDVFVLRRFIYGFIAIFLVH